MGCKSPNRRNSICGNVLRDAGRTVTKQTWKDWLYGTEKDMTLCSAGTVCVE